MSRARAPSKKAAHRQIIAELYLQGWNQYQIADEVGVCQQTVSNDLKVIKVSWQESTLMNFNERQSQELAKIDLLEVTYWEGWLRSTSSVTHRMVYDQDEGDWVGEKIELPMARDGDPRFLEGVRKCVHDRCKILGIQAPERVELTGKGGSEIQMRVIGGLDLEKDI